MRSAYTIISDRILDMLNTGVAPWRQPWSIGAGASPHNAFSKRPYRGINAVVLGLTAYGDPRWLTFKQTREHGGYVRQGEKATPVVFWKELDVEREYPETGDTKAKKALLLRLYHVFNVGQCDGLDLPQLIRPEAPEPIEAAERIVTGMHNPPRITYGGDTRAYYRPCTDSIHMPPRCAFESAENVYGVLFHELGHSTGHKDRLDRGLSEVVPSFGSEDYSREELVAEFTSAYLCHAAGVTHDLPNSAAYIANWAQAIRNDRSMVIIAASRAQKAADYVLGVTPQDSTP